MDPYPEKKMEAKKSGELNEALEKRSDDTRCSCKGTKTSIIRMKRIAESHSTDSMVGGEV